MATLSSPTVGVLGGGQLGRMLMESANRLNIKMNILDADSAPAKQISAHDDHVTGSFKDRESLRKLAASCDILTTEIEHVDTYALEEVSSKVKVEPSWQTIRTIQDKFTQKEHLAQFKIPMAEHCELRSNTSEELASIGKELGYPLMLKSKTQAYDGRGEESPRFCTASTYIYHRELQRQDTERHPVGSQIPRRPSSICRKMGTFQDGKYKCLYPGP
jgi:phosphoribosylaminoimidazole carboxylase